MCHLSHKMLTTSLTTLLPSLAPCCAPLRTILCRMRCHIQQPRKSSRSFQQLSAKLRVISSFAVFCTALSRILSFNFMPPLGLCAFFYLLLQLYYSYIHDNSLDWSYWLRWLLRRTFFSIYTASCRKTMVLCMLLCFAAQLHP